MKRKTLTLLLCACAVAGSVFFIVDRGYDDVPPLEENAFELYFDFDPEYNSGYRRSALLTIGEEIRSMGMPLTLVSKLEDTRATFLLKFPRGYRGLKRDAVRLKERLSRLRRDDGFFSFQTGKEAGVRSILLYFFGDERKRLEATVDEAAEVCSGVPGVTQVLKGYREGKTELVFTVEPSRMYSAGTNVSEVIGFLRYVFYFPVILKHYTGEKVIDVRGKVAVDGLRKEGIRSIGIVFGEGKRALLGDFTTLSNSRGSPVISRKNGKRFISLDLRYENAGEDDVMDAVQKRLKEVSSGQGGYYEFDEKHLEAKRDRLLVTASLALALFLSYVVLGTATNSFAWPLRMILVAPASLVGGAAFLAAGGYPRSASVHVGIILLIALSLTAPLLVVDEHLRSGRKRGEAPQGRSVMRACAERLRVLTAVTLVTALSMAPVFLLSGPANFFAVMCGFVLSGEASAYFIFFAVFPNLFSRSPAAGRPSSPAGEI